MSFLRGPLTRVEIERLMSDDPEHSAAPAGAATQASHASHTSGTTDEAATSGSPLTTTRTAASAGTAPPSPAGYRGVAPAPAPTGPAASLRHDQVTIPPTTPSGVRVRYLDPAAPWAASVGAQPGSAYLEAAVAARVHLRYDDTAACLDHTETYECIFHPLTPAPRPEDARTVDYDERDLRTDPPPHAVYTLPNAPIDSAAWFRTIEKQLKDHLYRTRTTDVLVNRELKLYSRAGEDSAGFVARCREAAAGRADEEAASLRTKVQSKLDRLEKQQRTAEHRVRELSVDSKQRVQQEIVAGAGQLLSVFLGGRGGVRSLSGVASRRGITRRTQERLDTAKNRLEDVAEEMQDIEAELADDLLELQEKWDACAQDIETKSIPLEQNDVAVEEIVLLWIPVEP
jgi:hypothetical protein